MILSRSLQFLLCFFLLGSVSAQSLFPEERRVALAHEANWERDGVVFFMDVKPQFHDTSFFDGCTYSNKGRKWLGRKLFDEHFLKTEKGNFTLAVDPLLDLQMGYDFKEKTLLYRNGRGLQVLGAVGDKLAFQTLYLESQARFPEYINRYVRHYEVVPGMTRIKDFKGDSYDYGCAMANISLSPWKFLNFQLGYGKNVFGSGYRSLLLSDNAYQYPFLKITTTLGRFEYVNLFTSFQNLNSDSVLAPPSVWYNGYQKKGGTFHYLGFRATRWLKVGLFEAVIWKARALTGRTFNVNQFIPVILLNTVRYALFSDNNVVLGLNAEAIPYRGIHVYGQFVLDDLHFKKPASGQGYQKTKYGYQVGIKVMDVAGLKNLHFQAEYNDVRPYTYGHKDPLQSYTHNNQELAHPLGANFRELVTFVDYSYKRIFAGVQFNYVRSGADNDTTHWGSNIFYSDTRAERGYNSFENYTTQGIPRQMALIGLQAGYMFNTRYNLCVEAGMNYRNVGGFEARKDLTFWLGLRTLIFNQYFDR
jgi:hypothetical protein